MEGQHDRAHVLITNASFHISDMSTYLAGKGQPATKVGVNMPTAKCPAKFSPNCFNITGSTAYIA